MKKIRSSLLSQKEAKLSVEQEASLLGQALSGIEADLNQISQATQHVKSLLMNARAGLAQITSP